MYTSIFPYIAAAVRPSVGLRRLRLESEIRRRENLSVEQMQAYQWSKLKEVINHAYANVPFYRKRYDHAGVQPSAINAPEDLHRLPIVTRQDVVEHLEEMIATNTNRRDLLRNATGGSTGSPMLFYSDLDGLAIRNAHAARMRSWAGFAEGQKIAIIWGADRDIPDMKWAARQYIHHIARQRWLNAYNVSGEKMEEFAHLLIRWQPRFILSYASSLFTFASFLKENGLDRIRPAAMETSAEKLFDYERALIEDVFRCKVHNAYGSREVPCIAYECEKHTGLHVLSDNVFIELLHDGQPAKPDEDGEVIVTALWRRAMPLIRYRNGDLARWGDDSCPCGRPFPLLSEILGRCNDVLRTPSGKLVHGAYFNHLFFHVPGVRRFQVHQKSMDEVVIKVISEAALPETVTAPLLAKVSVHLGAGVRVSLQRVDDIALTPTGKHRYILSDTGMSFAVQHKTE